MSSAKCGTALKLLLTVYYLLLFKGHYVICEVNYVLIA